MKREGQNTSLMSTCLLSFQDTGSSTVCDCENGCSGTVSTLTLSSLGSHQCSAHCSAEKRKSTITAVSWTILPHFSLLLKEEDYTYQISLDVIEEGVCCLLLACCSRKRTLEPLSPAPGTLLPTSDSKRVP